MAAVAAMLPAVRPNVSDRAHPSDAFAPVTIVQLVRLHPPAARALAQPLPLPPDAPRSRPVSLPKEVAPYQFALADAQASEPAVAGQSEDDEPLYRAPFRDAEAHADARLRAGLDCAHVDMSQLPRTELDLCAAAQRLRRWRG